MARGVTTVREEIGVSATRRFVVPIAIVMLLVGAAMVAVILYSARKMDENIVSSQTELIDNSLNARLTRSLSEVRSVAWWDEAVTKSRGTIDLGWLDLEVGAFMTESFHHDRIMILDEQNRPVYGYNSEGRMALPASMPISPRPCLWSARSAAAATSRRASPTPITGKARPKGIPPAATAAAPPPSSASAIMASWLRRWRSRRRST
jgi:hypothetical protein